MSADEITAEQAIALANAGWWRNREPREVALFQMHVKRLCMPFDVFHAALESALGRPVWTHELGLDWDGLLAELRGDRPAPSFEDILGLLGASASCSWRLRDQLAPPDRDRGRLPRPLRPVPRRRCLVAAKPLRGVPTARAMPRVGSRASSHHSPARRRPGDVRLSSRCHPRSERCMMHRMPRRPNRAPIVVPAPADSPAAGTWYVQTFTGEVPDPLESCQQFGARRAAQAVVRKLRARKRNATTGPGRPARAPGAEMTTVSVPMSKSEVREVGAAARREGVKRGKYIRDAALDRARGGKR
ncbi:MAG TPA: hypothetical protein VFQ42_22470 [Mycobacterium sp.]|nr:hypothetical protein [Mycobacterium sp.]